MGAIILIVFSANRATKTVPNYVRQLVHASLDYVPPSAQTASGCQITSYFQETLQVGMIDISVPFLSLGAFISFKLIVAPLIEFDEGSLSNASP